MPYRAPGPGDERIDWILAEINKAQRTLDSRIEEASALPDSEPSKASRIARLNAMKREVDSAFIDLDRNIGIWADRDLSNFYRRGHATAASQLPGAGFSFTLPHREALDLISRDAYDDVATRLQQVRDGFGTNVELQKIFERLDPSKVQAIQESGRSAVAQMLLTGEDPRKISKVLAQDLWSQGIQITDAGGRTWNPESYTRMLVRTKSANAYNAGSMNKYAEEGVSRVRVFDGVEHDEECAQANDEIWSLRYAMNHVIEHPNCRRAFAPEQGEGQVDKDTAAQYLVVFDRIELAVGAVAALRAFRATGEINVSSTLARLVLETAESAIGIPLPLIDVFTQGLLAGSFKSVDQYVESFVDPFLYSVGIIRNVPPRAGLKAALRPQNVIDEIANTVKAANREAFGVEFNPNVRRVLDRLDEATGKVISGVRVPSSGEQGGLKYVDWVLTHLSGERYGEIVAEAVKRAKAGDVDDLKTLWAESTSYIDDMREIRRLYIESILRTRSESERILDDLDQLLLDMKKLMGDQTDITNSPRVMEFLAAHELSPIDIERIIDYWSVQGREIRLSDYEVQRMKDLFQEAFEIRNRHLAIVEQMDEAVNLRRQRELLMAAPSGPDFASEANTLWDIDLVDQSVDSMRRRLTEITNNASGFDPDIQEMFEGFFRMLTFDPKDIDDIPRLRSRVESYLRANFNNTGLLVDPDDLPDGESVLDFFIRVVGDLKMQVDADGRPILTLFDDEVDDAFAREIASVLDWLDDSFWDNPARWREISDLHWDRDLISRHLPVGTRDTGASVKRVWRDFKNSIRNNERAALSNPYGNLGEVLKRAYTKSNVQTLGNRGANGYIYEVIDPDTGQKLLVKRITAGHMGGTIPAINSMKISNYLAEVLGDIEAVPTRFIQLTDNGSDWLVVMPYIEETKMWMEVSTDFLRDDVLRKFAVFDALSLEGDAHAGNYLANIYTETSTIIDREMSFGVRGAFDPRVDAPSFGMISAAREYLDRRLIDAWSSGDDIDFLKNAPPVRLHRLSDEEVEAITGLISDDIDNLLADPNNQALRSAFMREHGIVLTETGEAYVPTGRIGMVEDFEDSFPRGRTWWHSSFATESEFDFLEDIMDDLDAFDSRFYEDVREELADVFEEASDEARQWFIDHWAPNANFDDALNAAADHISHNVRTRAERLISGGTMNISGGLTKHIDPDTGKELRYGDVIKLTNRQTGEEVEGLVVNLFEADFDSEVVSIVVRPGVGLNKTASELASENVVPRVLRLDQWDFGESVDVNLASKIDEYRRTVDNYADSLARSRDPSDLRYRPVLDETGVRIGLAEETIEVENLDGTGIMKIVGNDEAEKIITFTDIATTPAVRDIIDSELQRIAPEFRPKKIKLSFRKLATEDGRSAFGVFNPETGELHLSLAPLFDTPGLTSRQGWDNSWFYDAAIDDWRMSQESIQHWISTLNVEGVRDVLRHELGHAVEVGVERQNFNRWSLQVLEQLRDEFPDLNLEDLRAAATDLLPDGFDTTGFPNDLAALIAYRAGLVEDVANTNLVFEAKELLESGMENRALPEWARSVYAGILREEPEAHHELFAEMYKRLNDILETAPPGTPSKLAIPRLAKELGVEPEQVYRFMTRSGEIELPDVWELSSEEFRRWMTDVLSPAADRIVPLEKNRNRMLWNAQRYNIADIRQRVLHTPPEEGGGGITINLVTGEEPSEGFAVAKKANERIYENITTDEEFDEVVEAYIKEFRSQLSEPEWELGMWLDSNGDLYLDTTKVFDDQVDAAVFGFREQQRAMYNLANFNEIKLLDGHEDIYGFIDDLPDFDVPYEEFLSRVERVSGVVKHIGAGADRVLEDQFERGGTFRVMSLEWMTDKDKDRVIDALRNRYDIPMTIDKGRANLEEILEMGLELYVDRPDLQDEYANFYFRWRDDFIEAATDTLGNPIEISMPQIAAAASRMSPALNADVNHDLVIDMANILSRDLRVNKDVIREVEGIYERSTFLRGVRKRIEAGTASQKDLAYAAQVEEILSELRSGRKINLLPPEVRVRAVAGALIAEDKTAIQVSRTWYFYEEAIAVMLGEKAPAQVLTDTKIRPFFNNILDPADLAQSGENTIDFIMAEAFFQARGFNNIGHTTPVVGGVSAGLRPVISDTLRVLYEERWRDELGLTSVSQLQSHIWNLWRYGVDNGWWTDLPTIGLR